VSVSSIDKSPIQLLAQPFSGGAIGAGATAFDTGWVAVGGYLNGRVRGNAHQDQDGTLTVEFGNVQGTGDLAFDVTLDAAQPDFQWPFDVIILQPFVRISFVNGGVASTFFRANAMVLSI